MTDDDRLNNLGFRSAKVITAVPAANHELGDHANLDALVRLALKTASR